MCARCSPIDGGGNVGDFGTPEQQIPATGFPDGRLWETCMTINGTWGYAANDTDWKSSTTLIRNLCDIAGKGGNFLLNVGPTAQGVFPDAINERLADMGRWMRLNGAAIYASQAGPITHLPENVRCTRKGSRLYLMVFDWPDGPLEVNGVSSLPVTARALAEGEPLSVERVGRTGIRIGRPTVIDPAATVVELRIGSCPAR